MLKHYLKKKLGENKTPNKKPTKLRLFCFKFFPKILCYGVDNSKNLADINEEQDKLWLSINLC